jgi:hypothetical protein
LTQGSDDDKSLERIHTFNLKNKNELELSALRSPTLSDLTSELYRTEGKPRLNKAPETPMTQYQRQSELMGVIP